MRGRWLMSRGLCLCVLMTRWLHYAFGLNADNSREPTEEYNENENKKERRFDSDLIDEDDPFSLRKIRPEDIGTGDKAFIKLAQGKYILLYIPGMLHCDYARYQIQNNDPLHSWREMDCSEAGKPGWIWTYPCDPGRWNVLRVFDKLSNAPIIYDKVYPLPEKPPKPEMVLYSNGPGWLYLFLKFPKEPSPNLLGIEVHYNEQQVSDIDKVKYIGRKVMLWPIHQCPQWPESKMFCILVTDAIVYEPTFFDYQCKQINRFYRERIIVQVRLFRIPYESYEREYSDPFVLKLVHNNCYVYGKCPPFDGELNITIPFDDDDDDDDDDYDDDDDDDHGDGENGADSEVRCPNMEDLWIIFMCLCLFVGLVIVPILFLLAQRRGRRKAYELWAMWAEAPGNVGIGLGYTAILWKGKRPPWKYDHPPSKPENQPGYKGRK